MKNNTEKRVRKGRFLKTGKQLNTTDKTAGSLLILVGSGFELSLYVGALKKKNSQVSLRLYVTKSHENITELNKSCLSFAHKDFVDNTLMLKDLYEEEKNFKNTDSKIDVFYLKSAYEVLNQEGIIHDISSISPSSKMNTPYYFYLYYDETEKDGEILFTHSSSSYFVRCSYWNRYGILYRMASLRGIERYKGQDHDLVLLGNGEKILAAAPYLITANLPLKGCLSVYIPETEKKRYEKIVKKLSLAVSLNIVKFFFLSSDCLRKAKFNKPFIYINGDEEDAFSYLDFGLEQEEKNEAKLIILTEEEIVTPLALDDLYPNIFNNLYVSFDAFADLFGNRHSEIEECLCAMKVSLSLKDGKQSEDYVSFDSLIADPSYSENRHINYFFPGIDLLSVYNTDNKEETALINQLLDSFSDRKELLISEIYSYIVSLYGKDSFYRDLAKKEHDSWLLRTLLFSSFPLEKKRYLVSFESLEEETILMLKDKSITDAYQKDPIFSDYLIVLAYLYLISRKEGGIKNERN